MLLLLSNDGKTVDEYPYTFKQLWTDNPGVDFDKAPSAAKMAEWGLYVVTKTARPESRLDTGIQEATPVLVDGIWTQSWAQEPATAKQIAQRAKNAVDQASNLSVKSDTFVQNFIAMTPAEVEVYIETNVQNLASAKSVINKLALMVLILARNEFR